MLVIGEVAFDCVSTAIATEDNKVFQNSNLDVCGVDQLVLFAIGQEPVDQCLFGVP